MAHELVEALTASNLRPCRILREMLDEQPQHRTERRGCGLTQATRFLAERINRPRDPLDASDLAMFEDWPLRAIDAIASRSVGLGWSAGWRDLSGAPNAVIDAVAGLPGAADLLSLPERLAEVRARIRHPESHLLLTMIDDILACRVSSHPSLPVMEKKPEIGSCSQAEEFFLEIAHGKIRRGGRVNLWVSEQRQPVLVEKIGLGESHSAMFVRKAAICGVTIPPGGLAALRHREDAVPLGHHANGEVFSLSALAQVRFLRLTTLALEPAHRERAFGEQFRRQVHCNLLSPGSTTLDDLRRFAAARIGRI